MKILAICGSTKKASINLSLIYAIAGLVGTTCDFQVFNSIETIPQFNPDHDTETPPQQVRDFRRQLKEADGILICTPEYAMGVPGTLKNAIDWTVSSCEFSNKPVALITASSQGQKGHAALFETLKIIESAIDDDMQLLISFVKTKVSADGRITDPTTLELVKGVIQALLRKIDSLQIG